MNVKRDPKLQTYMKYIKSFVESHGAEKISVFKDMNRLSDAIQTNHANFYSKLKTSKPLASDFLSNFIIPIFIFINKLMSKFTFYFFFQKFF